jgi:hypothetical protein
LHCAGVENAVREYIFGIVRTGSCFRSAYLAIENVIAKSEVTAFL